MLEPEQTALDPADDASVVSVPRGAAALVALAERANPKRSYLVVSAVLGKHVPVAGARCRLSGLVLALAIAGDARGNELGRVVRAGSSADAVRACAAVEADPASIGAPVVVFGFAETATGLAEQVASGLDADFWQTTTRRTEGSAGLAFTEAHSHAPSQWIIPPPGGWPAGVGVLVDDELSTGATAARLLEVLHRRQPRQRWVVAALVDRRPAGRGELEDLADRLGVTIDVVSLERRETEAAPAAGWSRGRLPVAADRSSRFSANVRRRDIEIPAAGPPQHVGQDRGERRALARTAARAAEAIGPLARGALVLGTGEHLAVAQRGAAIAGVLTSSSTRSPALVSTLPGYPIAEGLAFGNPDGPGVAGFAYNVRAAERPAIVVHFADPEHRDRGEALIDALVRDGAREIITVTIA